MKPTERFQQMAPGLFGDISFVTVIIDDVIISLKSLENHVEHTAIVCERIRQSNLKFKMRYTILKLRR